jgi:hypothetical protein
MGIHTAIDINAPAETVWRILMDFAGACFVDSAFLLCCAPQRTRSQRARAPRRLRRGALMRLAPASHTAYPSWNPFIKELSGDAKVGARLRAKIAPPGQAGMVFKPVVLVCTAPTHFLWRGSFLGAPPPPARGPH